MQDKLTVEIVIDSEPFEKELAKLTPKARKQFVREVNDGKSPFELKERFEPSKAKGKTIDQIVFWMEIPDRFERLPAE